LLDLEKDDLYDKLLAQVDREHGVDEGGLIESYRLCFEDYAKEQLKIRGRDINVGLLAWEFNNIQQVLDNVAAKQVEDIGYVRIITPKRRRGGVSTYVQGRFYWHCSLNPLIEAFTIAHEAKSTQKIFNITKLMQEENKMAPPTKYSSRIELSFLNRSNQGLATAGSPEAARSADATLFHWSEVAFSPGAERIMASTMAS